MTESSSPLKKRKFRLSDLLQSAYRTVTATAILMQGGEERQRAEISCSSHAAVCARCPGCCNAAPADSTTGDKWGCFLTLTRENIDPEEVASKFLVS